MDAIGVLFLLSSLSKSSWVSVVFDFNASLNNAAPVSPNLFPVSFIKKEKSDRLWILFVCFFLYAHHLD